MKRVSICPVFCVYQWAVVSCWSVVRADKDRLTYGRTGRREQEGAQHAEGGKRGDMTGGYKGRGRRRNVSRQGRKQEGTKRKEMKKGKTGPH